ncbi:transposase [Acidisoma silvae]|uniref:Transposase n=1 Tax=Acidisoma silvae TaxID=2802396 RepID=A0A963YVV7_9PROT|nr:transposase [Acidisoma silvae]MCB8878091.1 transposase [Acidisoma silvae]
MSRIAAQKRPPAVGDAVACRVPPIVGAALCIKRRGLPTDEQAAKMKTLKETSPKFAMMRILALRCRCILRGTDARSLEAWLNDATSSGIYSMRQFTNTLRHDLAAVRYDITERWSNGQTEGQINRLKALKRAM